MESATTTTTTKCAQSWQESTRKPFSYTVRHVYYTTMAVLLMWQTQHFILTVSLPVPEDL